MDCDLAPVPRVLGEAPDHPHRLAGCGGGGSLIDVVPDDRGDDAGPVGERKPHVVRSGPRATDLALADKQHMIDGASVLKVANVAGCE